MKSWIEDGEKECEERERDYNTPDLPPDYRTHQLIKSVLKPKGFLIVTVPNIAHWRMRWHLLLGHWDYQDYGLLDKTHLKFFTYFTFKNLISSAGFKIINVKIDPAGGFKYFNWLFKYFPNFYAHQICIQAQKWYGPNHIYRFL